ncbi:MAG: sulfatase-like hydrolase/transferase [Acidobacteriota bacterium]|nr:sulfatase-like hydrolase/transferase [Acidobacteriota bacterium]
MRRSPRLVSAVAVLAAVAAVAWWWSSRPSPRQSWPEHAISGGNLLLVTLDTLRADRLTDAAMPRLSALARTGHRFRTAYAHVPLTLPSHASILTGLLPPAHGVRGNGAFRLDAARLTLAERLAADGYQTGAFVGAFVLDSRFGLAQGFDRYESVDDDRDFAGDFAFAQRPAPAVLAGALQWIRDAAPERPWFAWVHLFDVHTPHDAPAAGLGPYDDEVHLVDAQLGDFLDRLAADGRLSRTLVIVTADHGESLGEHGESTHGLFVYDATMRVPLVVSGPGLGSADHTEPAALIDLVPTILDVLARTPDPSLPGRSLRLIGAAASSRPIYLEAQEGWLAVGAAPVSAVVDNGLKFIDVPEAELYDLAEDPGEARNLMSRFPERVPPLQAALREVVTPASASSTAPRDLEAEARLRSLGYTSGGPRTTPGSFAATDDPKRVLPLYERFLQVLADGGRDVPALVAIANERPAFEAARLAAASVLIETGKAPEAVALLEASPAASQALAERLGAAHLAAGNPARAAVVLGQAVADPQASADAWNGLGVARAQVGESAGARAALDQAVRLAPGSARIRMNHAIATLEAGDRPAAIAELVALTAVHPDSLDAWRLLATLRHDAGDKAGAVAAWRRALAIQPSDLDTLFNVAVTLGALGRTDEAREAATRFIALAPRPRYDREIATLLPLTRR